MNLKVLLPSEIFIEQEVTKVTAEAVNGSFCMLPQHIDFVAALVPGLFSYEAADGAQVILAMDEGVVIKRGADVLVSTRNAVRGQDLGALRQVVEEQFQEMDEREKKARTAAAKLEADLVRRFMELKEHG
ncbi:MAG: F0F1 ATP synthase subunit epsilon [Deltaproteobacteria bacterium]|nr:F0F1 ATP synthase subunit epsilon [Deltaproteobacteria bacterium]